MSLNVRLTAKTERALNALAKRRGLSRSDVVREAIAQYGAADERGAGDSPYDAWQDAIGVVALAARDPRRTTGDQFAAMVAEQARARRPR